MARMDREAGAHKWTTFCINCVNVLNSPHYSPHHPSMLSGYTLKDSEYIGKMMLMMEQSGRRPRGILKTKYRLM